MKESRASLQVQHALAPEVILSVQSCLWCQSSSVCGTWFADFTFLFIFFLLGQDLSQIDSSFYHQLISFFFLHQFSALRLCLFCWTLLLVRIFGFSFAMGTKLSRFNLHRFCLLDQQRSLLDFHGHLCDLQTQDSHRQTLGYFPSVILCCFLVLNLRIHL